MPHPSDSLRLRPVSNLSAHVLERPKSDLLPSNRVQVDQASRFSESILLGVWSTDDGTKVADGLYKRTDGRKLSMILIEQKFLQMSSRDSAERRRRVRQVGGRARFSQHYPPSSVSSSDIDEPLEEIHSWGASSRRRQVPSAPVRSMAQPSPRPTRADSNQHPPPGNQQQQLEEQVATQILQHLTEQVTQILHQLVMMQQEIVSLSHQMSAIQQQTKLSSELVRSLPEQVRRGIEQVIEAEESPSQAE